MHHDPRALRKTLPQDTKLGLLVSYRQEIEPLLIDGELRGRQWMHELAKAEGHSPYLTADHILDLNSVAFSHIYDWAGQPRHIDVGPGGNVYVRHFEVRVKLKELEQDFKYWYDHLPEPWDLGHVAELLAYTHHNFEYIHPFVDTNGRTGRLLDHYILWVSLGLTGPSLVENIQLDHFPNEKAIGDYFEGLHEATNRRDYRSLTKYYLKRLEEAVHVA